MLEIQDTWYKHDPRCPFYNPAEHGYKYECVVCGEYIHEENDLHTYLSEDDFYIYGIIGHVHDECLGGLDI